MRLTGAAADPGCRDMSSAAMPDRATGFSLAQYLTCLSGIVWREALPSCTSANVSSRRWCDPLVWLSFAAGFRQVLGISIIPPYEKSTFSTKFTSRRRAGDDPVV